MATKTAERERPYQSAATRIEGIAATLEKLSEESQADPSEAQTLAYQKAIGRMLQETAELAARLAGGLPSTWSQYISARTAFGSDSALAETLGVNRSRVTRWKQGEAADPANLEKLRSLGIVVSLLSGYLDRRAIPDWLTGLNPHLAHRRPIDVLLAGRLSEVVAAIEAESRGAFA